MKAQGQEFEHLKQTLFSRHKQTYSDYVPVIIIGSTPGNTFCT